MPVGTDFITHDSNEDDSPLADAGVSAARVDAPIDRLRPNSDLHRAVLDHLMNRYRLSRNHMTAFYDRWRAAELQHQAYLRTETFESLRKTANKKGTPPEQITLTVPYTYSATQTICTYLLHTFCGRNPMFQVGARRGDQVERARNLEATLQYNADCERIVRKLWQYFNDGEKYGLQVMRVLWTVKERRKTVWKPTNVFSIFGNAQPQMQPQQETAITFEGNEIRNIDPFKFFPDPRVPMLEVAERGEFVFWKETEGKHRLRKAERAGQLKWVDAIPGRPHPIGDSDSERGRLSGGRTSSIGDNINSKDTYEILQGTCEIIPSKWGLGDYDGYEKWLFTIANEQQIIQAEPLDLDHDMHPVVVGEPYTDGYEFGSTSLVDYLGPMQEMLSWMFNSHQFNVRSALNNMFVVNPNMVEMEDFKKPGPGRLIKLKPAAFGQKPEMAVYQVPVQDVTAGHVQDMQVVQRIADNVSATNDNLRGVINSGGRKSATEIRQGNEAGASRLAAHARLESAQSITGFAEMMTINLQQNMSQEIWVTLHGPEKAMKGPVRIGPEDISADVYFPVHDGTLPLDRTALLDIWKEIFMGIIQIPGMAQIFDAVGIFEYMAELGGAKNLSTFKVQGMGNEQISAAVAQGSLVPAGSIPEQ